MGGVGLLVVIGELEAIVLAVVAVLVKLDQVGGAREVDRTVTLGAVAPDQAPVTGLTLVLVTDDSKGGQFVGQNIKFGGNNGYRADQGRIEDLDPKVDCLANLGHQFIVTIDLLEAVDGAAVADLVYIRVGGSSDQVVAVHSDRPAEIVTAFEALSGRLAVWTSPASGSRHCRCARRHRPLRYHWPYDRYPARPQPPGCCCPGTLSSQSNHCS